MSLNRTILVVDDNPSNLAVVSAVLVDAGYTPAAVLDGKQALKRIQKYPPALILLDIQMPGMDGFETCQHLKSDPTTASIPIIFMTALADTHSKVKGLSLGAVDYISKPFQEQELLARVSTHLRLHDLTQHLEERVVERTEELQTTLNRLSQAQLQIIQHEKMSALGNLVAGVAHEINNPVGFLEGNLEPAREYFRDLLGLIDLYQTKYPNPDPDIDAAIEAIELAYLREDLDQLLSSMATGINRIRNISVSLRTFSRADKEYKVPFDIREGLDSTILILKHRLKANGKCHRG